MTAVQLFIVIIASLALATFAALLVVGMIFTGKEKIIKAQCEADKDVISMKGAAKLTLRQFERGEIPDA